MNHVFTMRSEVQHHVEDNGAAERSGRLDCVDSPHSSFTDRENSNLLQCRQVAAAAAAAADGCTIKYRRYG